MICLKQRTKNTSLHCAGSIGKENDLLGKTSFEVVLKVGKRRYLEEAKARPAKIRPRDSPKTGSWRKGPPTNRPVAYPSASRRIARKQKREKQPK